VQNAFFFLCCFIPISLFKPFPMANFGSKNQMMPGLLCLFLKEIATKTGIQHPTQRLHFLDGC